MKTQEVKPRAPGLQVHEAGLGRLRLQSEISQQGRQALQRPLGLAAGPAHHDQVVGEPHQHPVALVPCPVEPVQVDVAHQR